MVDRHREIKRGKEIDKKKDRDRIKNEREKDRKRRKVVENMKNIFVCFVKFC